MSDCDPTAAASYLRKALILIVLAFLLRALYAALIPVHLAGDEAYYWDWGRRPALGYFSKPPLIAWIYAVVDRIGQSSLFAIRFASVLLGTISLLVVWILTRKIFDEKTAFFAVVLGLAVPGICLLSFVLTIDAPLVLFWSLSLLFLWSYVNGERPVQSLILLFLCLGLGHLSKQMMLVFLPLALVFLASGKETRPLLRRPGPWLALAGSAIFLAPPYLIWNSQNDWITFHHMSTHVGAKPETSLWATLAERAKEFLEFAGSQIGALSPVVAVLVFLLTVVAMFTKRAISVRLRFLIVFCGVPLLLGLTAALFQKVQPNWLAVAYLAGVPMTAAWFAKRIDWFPVSDLWRTRLFWIGIGLGFAIGAYFYLAPIGFRLAGAEGHKLDPQRRFLGSNRIAAAVQEVRESVPGWEDHFLTASGHRYQTAWLAFELPGQPRVYRVAGNKIESQYEVWPGPWDDGKRGRDAILVIPGARKVLPKNVRQAFRQVDLLKSVEVRIGPRTLVYTIFRGQELVRPIRHFEHEKDN